MKKVLLIAIFSFFINGIFGQTSTPGVTVIVHGFDLTGKVIKEGSSSTGFKTWQEHAISLRQFAKMKTGNVEATVFYNNTHTGYWQILEKDGNDYRQSTKQTYNPNGEIIFLYDWGILSSEGVGGVSIGGLEAAADNLFAMLTKPIVSYKGGVKDDIKITTALPGQLLKDRLIHFIAHSRGNIVSLQVFNRLKQHFNTITIDQWTALDPHPASKMGDIETTGTGSLNITTQSLPYVFGSASGCNDNVWYSKIKGVCGTNNNIKLDIPSNVNRVDNYFRMGPEYEPLNIIGGIQGRGNYAEFSGVSIPRATYNRRLNDTIMVAYSDKEGGAHSAVHNWYWATFDSQNSPTFINDSQKVTTIPKVAFKNTNHEAEWFSNSIGSWFASDGSKNSTGYNHSRLGGGTIVPLKSGVEIGNSLKRKIRTPYNPSFENDYFDAGWKLNGGKNTVFFNGASVNGYGNSDGNILLHSYFYFPSSASQLVIKSQNPTNWSSGNKISVSFKSYIQDKYSGGADFKITGTAIDSTFIDIPANLKGKVGTILVEFGDNIAINDVYLINSSNSNLRLDAIQSVNGKKSSTPYFDFPVTYNVNPTPLIKGVRPNSFNAIIQNTLSSTWAGTLTMTWRKVTESGRGIPLVSKGVNLAPNATVTLDRGTQQIISEAGEYVLAIYANNDTDPIDRYYFYVEEPDEVISSTISVTPSTSNYTFGDVIINTTKSQTFTIKNTSTTSVNISNYVLTGTGFTQGTTTCCGTLAPNQSYDVTVNFQPTASNTYNGNLQINGSFTDSPINISLTGTGVYTTPPNTGCLASSLSTVNIQSGSTDAPKQEFFTLTNTSLTGAVAVSNISITGADASYFSYDGNLFSVPTQLSPSLTTGFLVKFNNPQNTTRTYNATLNFTTSNFNCPSLSIPLTATHTPSQLTWLTPPQDQTYEAFAGNNINLQWQGYLPQPTYGAAAVDIQYTTDGGQTWTSKTDSQGQTCTNGHLNNGINSDYFTIDQFAGKDIQFRIKPCYENTTPWKYSGNCHIIQVGQPTLKLVAPNGYEVLTGGTSFDIKWSNFIGYQTVNLFYSLDNGGTWLSIATNVSGQARYYRWQVPTGIKNSLCLVKVTTANISDQSDNNFTIQPALTTPITYANLTINPEGCGSTPNGGTSFQLLGGTPPYFLEWIEAGIGVNTINANYVTTSVTGLRAGTNRCVVTDANYNKVLYTFNIPQKANFTYNPIITKATCSAANGIISVLTNGDFQYPFTTTLSKDGTTILSGINTYFPNLSSGIYSLTLQNYDGCQQNTSLFVDTTPGTFYTVTPTVTNTGCGSSTGAISLNFGSAQNPTYLWSNGATTQNLTALSAGQYFVNVTDATGCVQSKQFDVFETGGLVENKIAGIVSTQGDYGCFQVNQGKLYFGNYKQTGTPTNSLGILDIPSNAYDYITIPSLFYTTSTSGLVPITLDVAGTDIYTAVYDWNGSGRDTHYLKISKATKQITGRKIVLGDSYLYKMQYINGNLYTLRSDNSMDIVNFSVVFQNVCCCYVAFLSHM